MAKKKTVDKINISEEMEDKLKAIDAVRKDLTKRFGDGTLQSLGEAKHLEV